jgi:hypothetical protein
MFFALSEPIWIGDLGTEPKKHTIFYHLTPDLIVFGFLPHDAAYFTPYSVDVGDFLSHTQET